MQSYLWPARSRKNKYGQTPSGEILLVTEILIRGYKQIESVFLRDGQELSVGRFDQPISKAVDMVWPEISLHKGTGVP